MTEHLIQEGHYELFPYQRDIGIRGVGWSEEAAFEQAAVALSSLSVDLEKIRERTMIFIHCSAPNHELLLLNWLNAIIYEAGRQKMLFKRFEVHFLDHQLEGIVWGEPIGTQEHHFPIEAKEASPACLSIEKQMDGHWIAQCVIET